MQTHQRFALSAVLAAIVFGIGYFVVVYIPGAGPTPDKNYADFYGSDRQMRIAGILSVVLLVGSLAMLWFFNELRARLPDGMLTRVGYTAAMVGVIAVPIGAAIMVGPAGAKQNGDGAFVGIPTALAFAQAGLAASLLVGMTGFAFAAILMSLAARGSALVPGWLAIGGVVLGFVTLGSYVWLPGFAFLAWVLLTGITVGLRGEPPERAQLGRAVESGTASSG